MAYTRATVTAAAALAVALFVAAAATNSFAMDAGSSASVPEQPAIPENRIPKAVKDAVAAPGRPAADKELDAGREPEQVMAFFGISPGMKVADLFAGSGYTTELLSRIVGPKGTVYSQNSEFPPRLKRIGEAWADRLERPALANVVAVNRAFDADRLLPVAPGSLDAVVIHLSYHDLVWLKVDRDKMNASVFRALKPGGIYGVVDHSARPGSGTRDAGTLHRIDEAVVISEVEKVGFKLAAASNALRHPGDDRTWMVFKHRGQTDRFMLKFVKP